MMAEATIDLAIIGAGPAGLSAATEARALGLSVALFDEQPAPGGQIYRNVTQPRGTLQARVLGRDYAAGRPLAEAFLVSGAAYHPASTVWRIGADGLSFTTPEGGGDLAARHVLVATGAMERPFAVPGWTLPGVMTAGAAQILLKTTGSLAEGAVFAGCGPLLYLVACQYLQAGARIAAILDTTPKGAFAAALPHLPRALRQPGLLWKGAGLLAKLRRSGVPIHRNVAALRFEGDTALARVCWTSAGRDQSLDSHQVFLHHGVIPNPNMTMAARAAHRWDAAQAAFVVACDAYGRTSQDWLWVAGDGGGIAGARAAALSGRIAARAIARDLGRMAADPAALLPHLARETAARPFLDRLYRPSPHFLAPRDDATLLCRCEEVTRGALARAVAEGCPGPNQFKAFTRAGMGPCQGRMCGTTIAQVFADLTGQEPQNAGYYRIRMPVKPVTVGEIAGLPRPAQDRARGQ
ncbi:FAD-dependent oxidoreductase [Neotabrizicola sp. sgz301269]|uniref:FAD/NAD(P)-dependent oxidoreductase n=1 Tax=Neotabrizicola sp. sgz301269 TaxID=3276282 RepID=UPI0037703E41